MANELSTTTSATTSASISSWVVFLSRLKKYLTHLKSHWWVLILTISAGIGIATWLISQKAPSYRSVARMMVQGQIALPEGSVYNEELSNFYGTQIELMSSAEVQRRAAARVESLHPEIQPRPVNIQVSMQRGTSFFILMAVGDEANYTKEFLDACMEEYIRFKRELRSETQTTALTSITDELLKLDKDAQNGEDELMAFRKNNNVVFLEEEGNSAAKYLVGLKQNLANLKTEYELLKLLDLDQNLERQKKDKTSPSNPETNGKAEKDVSPYGPELDYLKAKQQIQLITTEKDRLSKVMRPNHPRIVQLEKNIKQQEKLFELFREQSLAQLATRREGIGLQIQNTESQIKEWEGRALELNLRIAEYNRLKSKVDRIKALSERLLGTVQSVDVSKNIHQDVITIMEHASVPIATKPEFSKYLVTGGIFGLLIGVCLLIPKVLLDDRITSTVELQENFIEQVLGQVPKQRVKGRLNILNLDDKHHIFAESYRNLRSSLHFMSFEDPRPKTLLITSAVPGEGKSTVSVNLAITMASAGSRILLIDADLRRGVVHEYFSLPSSPGLSGVLKEKLNWRDAIVQTPAENLSFLPRGEPLSNTSEYFLGPVTDNLLIEMYKEFDYIIFDSAPVLANDDTTSLAPKVDAAIFVVRASSSTKRLVRSALDALYKRNVNVIGLVLNYADTSSPDYYYYSKYTEYFLEQPSA